MSAATSKGLGKGLSALMGESYSTMATPPAGNGSQFDSGEVLLVSGQLVQLPTESLQPGKYQPRRHFDEETLHELADSIDKNGIMQPLVVRAVGAGKYEIIAGERRWRAATLAKLETVPVIVRELVDQQALELALIENIQRQDLNPLEEAAGYKQLMEEFRYTQETLASTVGKSRSHIANLIRLLALPDDIRELLAKGSLTMGHARALLNVPNASELAKKIVAEGLNVREVEALARGDAPKEGDSPADQAREGGILRHIGEHGIVPIPKDEPRKGARQPRAKDPDILALEATLSENLGLKVSIRDYGGQKGDIVVEYGSLAQLDEILRRLGGSI